MLSEASRIIAENAKDYCEAPEPNEAKFEKVDDILNSEEYTVDYPVNDTGMSIF